MKCEILFKNKILVCPQVQSESLRALKIGQSQENI